jgi:hypothetical protein
MRTLSDLRHMQRALDCMGGQAVQLTKDLVWCDEQGEHLAHAGDWFVATSFKQAFLDEPQFELFLLSAQIAGLCR